ncbi:hypothetical protein [Parasitella parasitica]|uniref:Uncharacterized protein n=1 Tax=Parasitella parasitica TaxID=35722 RepID=A0A0B7N725_9FUNG|nr:hypothetical protein [Parasitella parasitica]
MDWTILIRYFEKPLVDTRHNVGVKAGATLQDLFHLISVKLANMALSSLNMVLILYQVTVFNLFLNEISDISLRKSTDNFMARGRVVSRMLLLVSDAVQVQIRIIFADNSIDLGTTAAFGSLLAYVSLLNQSFRLVQNNSRSFLFITQ